MAPLRQSIEETAESTGEESADLVSDAIADVSVRDVLPIPLGTLLTLLAGEVSLCALRRSSDSAGEK